MMIFKHFHKTPFWSQLVFGLVAILALPEIQGCIHCEAEQETVINQSYNQISQNTDELEQALFIAQTQQALKITPQAVVFGKFLAKSYRFEGKNNYPIRAGPFSI